MHLSGFTSQQIAPHDSRTLLHHGCGLTTMVERATAREDQIDPAEYAAAAGGFQCKIAQYRPAFVAFLGKPAFAGLTNQSTVAWGPQSMMIAGAKAWVLPNPSGRNRSFDLTRLVEVYQELRLAAFPA